jgi:hypothetical protein
MVGGGVEGVLVEVRVRSAHTLPTTNLHLYPLHFARLATLPACLQEERNYILQMVKKIRASGANVLLIQKSILRDAVTDLSLHYLVRERVTVVVLLDDLVGGAGMLCVECGAG